MFQMALLLFKENNCAMLFWNPCINVEVMARTPFYHLTFKCDLDLQPIWTNVLNGISTCQGEKLCQIVLKSMHKLEFMAQINLDGQMDACTMHTHTPNWNCNNYVSFTARGLDKKNYRYDHLHSIRIYLCTCIMNIKYNKDHKIFNCLQCFNSVKTSTKYTNLGHLFIYDTPIPRKGNLTTPFQTSRDPFPDTYIWALPKICTMEYTPVPDWLWKSDPFWWHVPTHIQEVILLH